MLILSTKRKHSYLVVHTPAAPDHPRETEYGSVAFEHSTTGKFRGMIIQLFDLKNTKPIKVSCRSEKFNDYAVTVITQEGPDSTLNKYELSNDPTNIIAFELPHRFRTSNNVTTISIQANSNTDGTKWLWRFCQISPPN